LTCEAVDGAVEVFVGEPSGANPFCGFGEYLGFNGSLVCGLSGWLPDRKTFDGVEARGDRPNELLFRPGVGSAAIRLTVVKRPYVFILMVLLQRIEILN